MDEDTIKPHKKTYDWLKQYQFQKGNNANPNGRPKGKSLKTFVREMFESMAEEDKADYLKSLDPEMVWKMAEGNPDNKLQGDKDNPITLVLQDINGNSFAKKLQNEGISSNIPPSTTEI